MMRPLYHKQSDSGQMSGLGRDVSFGIDQDPARHTDDPFIRPTPCSRRQERFGCIRHVDADDGEIAISQLPDVRTVFQGRGALTVGVRVRADSAEEGHGR